MEPVIVIGAGLAGSEAAWQLARRGVPVTLREMKPAKMTPAHHTEWFGELVCSNSLRSDQLGRGWAPPPGARPRWTPRGPATRRSCAAWTP